MNFGAVKCFYLVVLMVKNDMSFKRNTKDPAKF